MSQILEELMTEPIGFIIAMVILTTAVVIGLYGYWAYANHVTLQNYLWPIAEVVPYKGSYYLAIVNTGYEPFVVKQVYLSGGSTISANTKPLTHNQWWFTETSQLPTAVKVCSAIDPRVCTVVSVHGWAMAEVGVPPDAILVVVEGSNTQGQGRLLLRGSGNCPWSLTWYGWAGNSISGTGNLTFLIQPVYGEVHFIPTNLVGPSEASPGSVVIFNVNCPSNNGLPPWLW
jgi:hypothetical protein